MDLKKAYDSVPREALWAALKKLGLPGALVSIIKSFHQNMTANVRVDDELLEGIDVRNGLRQGCTIAPTLFNLYACLVADRWSSRTHHLAGTCMYFKFDQKIFRKVHRKCS